MRSRLIREDSRLRHEKVKEEDLLSRSSINRASNSSCEKRVDSGCVTHALRMARMSTRESNRCKIPTKSCKSKYIVQSKFVRTLLILTVCLFCVQPFERHEPPDVWRHDQTSTVYII